MDPKRIDKLEERQDRQEQMHYEAVKVMTEVATELRVTNSQFANISERQDKLENRLDKISDKTNELKNTQEGFRPFIDLVKSINNRIWFLLIGGIGTMAFVVWSKLG